MAQYANLRGTMGSSFQIGGPAGPQWTANGGALEARTAAAALAIVRGADPAAANDLTTKGYVNRTTPYLFDSSVDSPIVLTAGEPSTVITGVLFNIAALSTVRVEVDTNVDIAWSAAPDFGKVTFEIDITGPSSSSWIVPATAVPGQHAGEDSSIQFHWTLPTFSFVGSGFEILWSASYTTDSGSGTASVSPSTLFVTVFPPE